VVRCALAGHPFFFDPDFLAPAPRLVRSMPINRMFSVLESSSISLAAFSCKAATKFSKGRFFLVVDPAKWLEEKGMDHMRGAPFHPQTQGKIERWRQTMKTGFR